MTTNRLGIEQLTHMGMPPVELVKLVAANGCTGISAALGPMPIAMFGFPDFHPYADWSLENDPALRREMKAAMADTGVRIELGEGFRAGADRDVANYAHGLDLMAELGAQRINAVSMEPSLERTYDQLALLADMVIARGMLFTIEFAPMNTINNLASAMAAIDHIGAGRARVLIDAMHLFRSGGSVADVAALDPDVIGYAQLCDVPLAAPEGVPYFQEATLARLVPGTGELPLADWIAALPADLPIGIEVPRLADMAAGLNPRDHLANVVKAARALGA
ncbi:MAG: sugar phosphate isomerase/epimerase family protein [Novosphingobium sp.]|jgi:sugar phosphate isomerase/epimerase